MSSLDLYKRPRRRLSEGHSVRRESTDFSAWIEKRGVPVAQLALELGVTPKTVYHWAGGFRVPDLVAAYRIEHITHGEVTAMSFLKTKQAQRAWADLVAHSRAVEGA